MITAVNYFIFQMDVVHMDTLDQNVNMNVTVNCHVMRALEHVISVKKEGMDQTVK